MHEESARRGACSGLLRKSLGAAPETRDELLKLRTRFTSILRTRYCCHA